MADLSSLGYKSISSMSEEESIKLILSIRLSRRTHKPKSVKKKTTKKLSTTKTRKASTAKNATKLTPQQALRVLQLLEEL